MHHVIGPLQFVQLVILLQGGPIYWLIYTSPIFNVQQTHDGKENHGLRLKANLII